MFKNQVNHPMNTSGLDVLSWNINDVMDGTLGAKTASADFVKQLSASQIFLLQETKGDVKIPGYTCYNKLRKDSRSGGLCIGIRREISHLVKPISTTKYDDIMAVRLKGKLLEENRDLILVNVYDSPENSSYKSKKIKMGTHRPTLDILRDFLANIQDGTPYFIVGDFNARIGRKFEPVRDDRDLFDALRDGSYSSSSHAINYQRNSEDSKLNERGKNLLDLIRGANLKILNGTTIGDVMGRFTCLRYNGSSVIDYMLAEDSLLSSISNFKVLDFTDFSDHRPIKCRLKRSTNIDHVQIIEKFTDQPQRYQWDQDISPVSYRDAQKTPQSLIIVTMFSQLLVRQLMT